jgi:hypothetical protein
MINQNSDLSIEKLATLQIFLYTIMETRLKQINKYTKKAVYRNKDNKKLTEECLTKLIN